MATENKNPITVFAKTNFRNQERVFGIKADDRRRHMYVIGKTGMGKTNLLENLAIQDIQQGHGICFIDPHGDVALKLIKAIPPERINDVIYFDPADQEFPIAFNVLEQVEANQRSLVASGLVGVFKKIWADSWGPRLEYILRNALLALLEYPGSSLLGVMRILVDKSYRERVVEKITDPVVKSFWEVEFAGWNERTLQEVISPIQNKVGQFTSNSLIRNIIGQTTSAFDVREIMDQKKILIMNLSKGKIGEDSSALLGAMMITKIQLAAMGRVDIPEEERNDFYLYVDEFQNFATESFANILSEARNYRLALILANQYITQLEEPVRDAIFGNAGTLISFRVGAADAEFLEKEYEPVFMMNDIVNLPKYQIYLKLMIDGIAGDAFSATTLPPILIETPGIDEKVVALTRERYATSQAEIEEKIRRWTGMLNDDEKAALLATRPAAAPRPSEGTKKPAPRGGGGDFRTTPRPAASAPAPRPTPPKPAPAPTPAPKPASKPVFAPVAEPVAPALPTPAPAPERVEPVQEEVVETVVVPQVVAAPVLPAPKPPRIERRESVPAPVAAPAAPTVIEPVVSEEEVASDEVYEEELPEAIPEKVLYAAICATCGIDIEVPFEPDASRPTFCKDCLRDYQRAVAKARPAPIPAPAPARPAEVRHVGQTDSRGFRDDRRPKSSASTPAAGGEKEKWDARPKDMSPARSTQVRAYSSGESPMKLSQMQHIEPKKFKALRRKPDINVDAVRALIDGARQSKGGE